MAHLRPPPHARPQPSPHSHTVSAALEGTSVHVEHNAMLLGAAMPDGWLLVSNPSALPLPPVPPSPAPHSRLPGCRALWSEGRVGGVGELRWAEAHQDGHARERAPLGQRVLHLHRQHILLVERQRLLCGPNLSGRWVDLKPALPSWKPMTEWTILGERLRYCLAVKHHTQQAQL